MLCVMKTLSSDGVYASTYPGGGERRSPGFLVPPQAQPRSPCETQLDSHLADIYFFHLRTDNLRVVKRDHLDDNYEPFTKRKIGPVEGTETWNDILKSDSRTKEDDYVSIRCEEYGTGEYLGDKQEPWRVYFSSIALTIADLHAHLNDWEGGGLLYGEVDEEKRVVFVDWAVPRRVVGRGRGDFDLAMAADGTETMDSKDWNGLLQLGWYQSHPNYDVHPFEKETWDLGPQARVRTHDEAYRNVKSRCPVRLGLITCVYHPQLLQATSVSKVVTGQSVYTLDGDTWTLGSPPRDSNAQSRQLPVMYTLNAWPLPDDKQSASEPKTRNRATPQNLEEYRRGLRYGSRVRTFIGILISLIHEEAVYPSRFRVREPLLLPSVGVNYTKLTIMMYSLKPLLEMVDQEVDLEVSSQMLLSWLMTHVEAVFNAHKAAEDRYALGNALKSLDDGIRREWDAVEEEARREDISSGSGSGSSSGSEEGDGSDKRKNEKNVEEEARREDSSSSSSNSSSEEGDGGDKGKNEKNVEEERQEDDDEDIQDSSDEEEGWDNDEDENEEGKEDAEGGDGEDEEEQEERPAPKSNSLERALVLGMTFYRDEEVAGLGDTKGFADVARLYRLERALDMKVFTIDPDFGGDFCRSPEHLQANFRVKKGIKEAIRRQWPPGEFRFPVVYVDWVGRKEKGDKKVTPIITKQTFQEVVPLLRREYGTEAVWFPLTALIVQLLEEEQTFKILHRCGLGNLLVACKPEENLLYVVTRWCDDFLSEASGEKVDSWEDLTKVLDHDAKELFGCLQIDEGTCYGARKTRPYVFKP